MLDEKIKAAADMYPFKITDSYRTRGGFVCVTDDYFGSSVMGG